MNDDLEYRLKKLEQRHTLQMKSFRDQLNKLSEDVEAIKTFTEIYAQSNLELTIYFSSLQAQVSSIAKTLNVDLPEDFENPNE